VTEGENHNENPESKVQTRDIPHGGRPFYEKASETTPHQCERTRLPGETIAKHE
jgi:hypothetical protein